MTCHNSNNIYNVKIKILRAWVARNEINKKWMEVTIE